MVPADSQNSSSAPGAEKSSTKVDLTNPQIKNESSSDAELKQQEDQAAIDLLEKALQEHDPDFQTSLTSIGPDLMPENMEMFGLDAETEIIDDRKVKKFITKIRLGFTRRLKVLQTRVILFFKQTLLDLLRDSAGHIKNFFGSVKAILKKFSSFSGLQKLTVFFCFALAIFVALFIHRFSTKGILTQKVQLFTPQLDELASEVHTVEVGEPMSSFFDSPRVSQNVMSLKRMVVNIRSSDNSGPQPMVAVEFFIEGYAPEVVIEVKDREAEVQHLFQRVIESFSYDELDSAKGKKNLQDRLRDRINQILTQGNVKRVFFKNFILKP